MSEFQTGFGQRGGKPTDHYLNLRAPKGEAPYFFIDKDEAKKYYNFNARVLVDFNGESGITVERRDFADGKGVSFEVKLLLEIAGESFMLRVPDYGNIQKNLVNFLLSVPPSWDGFMYMAVYRHEGKSPSCAISLLPMGGKKTKEDPFQHAPVLLQFDKQTNRLAHEPAFEKVVDKKGVETWDRQDNEIFWGKYLLLLHARFNNGNLPTFRKELIGELPLTVPVLPELFDPMAKWPMDASQGVSQAEVAEIAKRLGVGNAAAAEKATDPSETILKFVAYINDAKDANAIVTALNKFATWARNNNVKLENSHVSLCEKRVQDLQGNGALLLVEDKGVFSIQELKPDDLPF